jgi:hypothetical protein
MIKKINDNLVLGGVFGSFSAQNKLQGTVRVPNIAGLFNFVAISVIGINGGWAASLITENGESLALNRMPQSYDKQITAFLSTISDTSKYQTVNQEIGSYKIPIAPVALQLVPTDTSNEDLKKATFNCTSVLTIAPPNVQNVVQNVQNTAVAGGF